MKPSAALIEAFAGTFISPRYDSPAPTPQFHRDGWALYANLELPQVAIAAPRDHAKSTAFTMDYILAEVLFRWSDYVILVGSTEESGQEQLGNISEELHSNEDLRREFGIVEFEVDQKTEVIVKMDDGHRFRILVRGAEQRIRGRLWNGKRPNLMVCDDMEDDEQVQNKDRRRKFRHWFFRAAKQALSKTGRIRVHGTILHEDSLLSRLMRNETWTHKLWRAHKSFDDFSELLWPIGRDERWLRQKRAEFVADNDSAGYSQEYLNDPFDHDEAYLRRDDFIGMEEEDYLAPKVVCAAWDFAITEKQSSDRTSCTIGGKCARNLVHVLDQRIGRWHSLRIVDEIFAVQEAHNPEIQWVEDDTIWKAIAPMLYREMQIRDKWLNIFPIKAVRDKATRGRSYQKRHRARAMRFDKKAEWYPGYEDENLRFTGTSQATHDDQFDSTALLSRGFDDFKQIEEDDFTPEATLALEREDPRRYEGQSPVTGY
jgi:phage terminase large subunit-like protein